RASVHSGASSLPLAVLIGIPSRHVLIQYLDKVRDYVRAFERGFQFAVDEDGRARLFAGSWQADSDVGVLRFAGAVDHASHDRDLHLLDSFKLLAPDWHLRAQVFSYVVGHLLKERTGRTPAAGAGRDLRGEAADAE